MLLSLFKTTAALEKKGFILGAMAAALLTLTACGEDEKSTAAVPAAEAAESTAAAPASDAEAPAQEAAAAPAPAADAAAPAAPESKVSSASSFDDKVSYSIGASVGGYIGQMLAEQGEFLGSLNPALIEQGFKDALAGNSSLTPKEIEETLQALDQKVQEQMTAKFQQEAQQNLEAGQKFLAENAKKEGVVTTASGLQYKVIKAGTGKSPTTADTISVKYKGTTIDGQVFDEQTEPVSFPLQNMIPGWVEALPLMQEGAVYELYIPASLAYGENGAGNLIKPNSVLIFNVELVEVKSPEPAPAPAAPSADADAEDAAAAPAAEAADAPAPEAK